MNELPHGWAEAAVGEVWKVEYGAALPAARRAGGLVPVYGSSGVVGWHDEAFVNDPTVIVGRKGNAGACHVRLGPSWPIDTTYFIRIPAELDASFVGWQLQEAALRQLDSSTAVPSLRRDALERQTLRFAPIAEQRRIVAAIEEQLSRLDAATAAVRSAQSRLDAARDSAFASAFASFRPHRRLVELTDPARPICYGILKPRTDGELVVPYVEVRSIRDGRIDLGSLHRTTRALHAEFARSTLRGRDVVMAIRGSWDRAAVVPPELDGCNVSRDVARITPTEQLDSSFLAYFLVSPVAAGYFRRVARGVGVRGVNISDLRELPVPNPPYGVQKATAERLDDALSGLARLALSCEAALHQAIGLRRSILARAFRGELVPQDPDDEPASVLLERIAAERDAAEEAIGRRRRRRATMRT